MTKSFKRLKDVWYKKIKKAGFEDIEDEKGNLKADTDHRTIAYALQVKSTREAYYRAARDFLHRYQFATPMQKYVWDRHCEGIGRRRIARELNVTTYQVEKIIINLSIEAGLRKQNG